MVGSAARCCQPVAAGSALSLWKAASSAAAHGQSCWRRSLPRRPWNASRAATCRSRYVKRRRHTPEQVIRKLREADRMLGEGRSIAEVCKALEVSEPTYHRWRNQYGGMKADDAKRLEELERENARLKRIVADQALETQALKEIAKGNF